MIFEIIEPIVLVFCALTFVCILLCIVQNVSVFRKYKTTTREIIESLAVVALILFAVIMINIMLDVRLELYELICR